MLYYSEKSKKFYKTENELRAAEKEYDAAKVEEERKAKEKKAEAKAVEAAYKKAQEVRSAAAEMIKQADEEYYNLRNKFVEKYGSFHMSYSDKNAKTDDIISILDNLINSWPFN